MIRLTRRACRPVLAVVVVLTLAGCGTALTAEPIPIVSETPGEALAPIGYRCSGIDVRPEVLEAVPGLDTLDAHSRAAIDTATWDDGRPLVLDAAHAWFVADADEDEISVVRMLDEPISLDVVDVPPRDAAFFTVVRIDNATNLPTGWYVGTSGECALTVDLGDLTVPAISLDPSALPNPSDSRIHLLVTEQSCNSGQDATGRVEVVTIHEAASSVDIVIGIRPQSGAANCQSNPPTTVTVTLAAPLGRRSILNATLAMPRPIEVFELPSF